VLSFVFVLKVLAPTTDNNNEKRKVVHEPLKAHKATSYTDFCNTNQLTAFLPSLLRID